MLQGIGLVIWKICFIKQTKKDAKKISSAGLRPKVEHLLDVIKKDPFQKYPPYEKLVGDLIGAYSRRINIHHRLVYQVLKRNKAVKILRMWTHYE